MRTTPLVCGHDAEGEPLASSPAGRFHLCPEGCGVQKAKR
jgi:hypothetical protein